MAPLVVLAILVSQAVGGLASILTKLALEGLEPWTMVAMRQALGVLILLAISRARTTTSLAPRQPFSGRDVALLCTAAWGGFALPQALLAIGIERSTGTMGALLTPLEPIGIVLGGALVLGERLGSARVAALVLGTAGTLAVVGQGHLDPRFGDPLGDGLIALGHLSWAVYTIATKPLLDRHDPMRITIAIVFLSLPPMALFASGETFVWETARTSIVWVVVLAVMATAVGTWTWNYALRHVSAGTLGAFVFLQPLVGLAAGALWLGEAVGWMAVGGAALITAGVVLETRSGARAARIRRRAAADQPS
jgi:drug/metabolite transporter (DMT)-like permease